MDKLKYKEYLEKGDVFGYLTVIAVDDNSRVVNGKQVCQNELQYHCKCVCGKEVTIKKKALTYKWTRSCGCLVRKINRQNGIKKVKANRIEINGNTIKIFFFKNNNYTTIDTEDYEYVKDRCWYNDEEHYVTAKKLGKRIRIHRIIMNCPDDKIIDHIDRNPLNNKKENLRICTNAENAINKGLRKDNKSGYIGIRWDAVVQKWFSQITLNKKKIRLGWFVDKQDAINVRHEAEKKYFGEFAPKYL